MRDIIDATADFISQDSYGMAIVILLGNDDYVIMTSYGTWVDSIPRLEWELG